MTDVMGRPDVRRLDGGEVSTHLADVVEPGDELEVRGPIGGWSVWDGETPALPVAGGFGVGICPPGRLTAADLVPLWEQRQTAYVCGSAAFAEAASQLLVGMGSPAADVRVERLGPSGAPA